MHQKNFFCENHFILISNELYNGKAGTVPSCEDTVHGTCIWLINCCFSRYGRSDIGWYHIVDLKCNSGTENAQKEHHMNLFKIGKGKVLSLKRLVPFECEFFCISFDDACPNLQIVM